VRALDGVSLLVFIFLVEIQARKPVRLDFAARFLVSFSDFLVSKVFSCLRFSTRETSCRAATFGFLHVSVAATGLIFYSLLRSNVLWLVVTSPQRSPARSGFSVLSPVLGDDSVFGHPRVESRSARPRTCFSGQLMRSLLRCFSRATIRALGVGSSWFPLRILFGIDSSARILFSVQGS
jgi:hypothetical protein